MVQIEACHETQHGVGADVQYADSACRVRQARQHTELVLRGGWLTLLRLASERLSWPRFMDT